MSEVMMAHPYWFGFIVLMIVALVLDSFDKWVKR